MSTNQMRRYDTAFDPVLAKAHEIIDHARLDTGVTQEELDREEIMVDVPDILLAEGKTEDEARDYLKSTP